MKNWMWYLLAAGAVYLLYKKFGGGLTMSTQMQMPGGPYTGIPMPQYGAGRPGTPVTIAPTAMPSGGVQDRPGGPVFTPIPDVAEVSGPSIEEISEAPAIYR